MPVDITDIIKLIISISPTCSVNTKNMSVFYGRLSCPSVLHDINKLRPQSFYICRRTYTPWLRQKIEVRQKKQITGKDIIIAELLDNFVKR